MDYKHIKNPDGSWKYTNRLIDSSSPYLLQHAHNPVDWYPWGEEALHRALKEEKLIFVSVGYSTCYWCHVMEREVFCDEKIGQILNEYFINIKIDREERPDIDEVFMLTRQFTAGEAGWPNNLFLTPDLKPFFAGGTFTSDHRYGNISFHELILKIIHAWKYNKDAVIRTASQIMENIENYLNNKKGNIKHAVALDEKPIKTLVYQLLSQLDLKNGGFFNAPKFPHEIYLKFLLQVQDEQSIKSAVYTLDKIAAGGIHDHIGGGFHRYTIDAAWRIPHFEKMLYNQALISSCYIKAYGLTKKKYYQYIIETTLDFVKKELTSKEGGFYSALDAETDEIEGAYYTWNEEEINSLLTKQEKEMFFNCFSLTEIPKLPGHIHSNGKVINCYDSAKYEEQVTDFVPLFKKLAKHRNKRTKPNLDNKVIAGWHGLMMHAFASAAIFLSNSNYKKIAINAAQFLERYLLNDDNELLRIGSDHNTITGFLDDYAYSIYGLITVYESTAEPKWLNLAILLIEKCNRLFKDYEKGAYFYSREDTDNLMRIKNAEDSSTPSANAVMLHNMVRLALITKDKNWLFNKADEILHTFSLEITTQPFAFTHMIHGLLLRLVAEKELDYVKFLNLKTPKIIKIGETFEIEAELQVKKNYHIYSHHVEKNKYYPTRLEFSCPDYIKLDIKEINYPLGKEYRGFTIYDDQITIKAALMIEECSKPFDFNDEIKVIVYYQACDNNSCYEPTSIKSKFTADIYANCTNDNKNIDEI